MMLREKKIGRMAFGFFLVILVSNIPSFCGFITAKDGFWNKYDANTHPRVSLPSGTIKIKTAGDWNSFPGTGGEVTPFLIANRTIDGASTVYGISITGGARDAYFVIQNCTITNCPVGINLINIQPGRAKIINNTIINSISWNSTTKTGIGIVVESSPGTNITRNVIRNSQAATGSRSGMGIYIDLCDANIVTGNHVITTRATASTTAFVASCGMLFDYSNSNVITGNTVEDIVCGNYARQYSGNGIFINNGKNNNVINNTIHGTKGGLDFGSGNGIYIEQFTGWIASSNRMLNNTIYNTTSGVDTRCKWCGNGIAVVAKTGPASNISSTIIENNVIHDCMQSGVAAYYSGNGICLYYTDSTIIDGNKISKVQGIDRAGSGIESYYSINTIISNNDINGCIGTNDYSGCGIFKSHDTNVRITNNVVQNTWSASGQYSGAGMELNNEASSIVNNNTIVKASYSSSSVQGAGVGISLDYITKGCTISNNEIRDCNKSAGISLYRNCHNNNISRNHVSSSAFGISCAGMSGENSSANTFVENTALRIDIGLYSNDNTIEDNVVDHITLTNSLHNTIVGNKNYAGGIPAFTVTGHTKDQYWIKITSPVGNQHVYRGTGGIPLTFKYQFFGTELPGVTFQTIGPDDYYPRPKGLMYIPWQYNATGGYWYNAILKATDTSNPFGPSIQSSQVFPYIFSNSYMPDGLVINGNTKLGFYSKRGSGTSSDPFFIENRIINITQSNVAAGITIQNTNAFFVLRGCTVVGGASRNGIKLSNVTNGRIEGCTILGLPSTYKPGDLSYKSEPMKMGIVLDFTCHDNIITMNTVYRTQYAGILVEGDGNEISNNVISIALWNGINVTGSNNRVCNNIIAPFGGPDYYTMNQTNGYWFSLGISSHALFGIRIGGKGSSNTIEDNVVIGFPFSCIIIDNIACCDNTIIGNQFDSRVGRASNITDNGLHTHFLKITHPANGTSFIGYGAPNPGYYPGTDGFEDVADGSLPASWTCSGTGGGYSANVIVNKTDQSGYFTHQKVLYCYTGEGVSPNITVIRWFAGNVSSGTIEFWVLKKGALAGNANFTIGGTAGTLFKIMLDNGIFKFRNGSSINSTGVPFEDAYWYRLSIDFSDDGSYAGLAAHQYRLKIYNSTGDGLLCPPKVANYMRSGSCNRFAIVAKGGPSSNLSIYIDAVGYSWGAGYSLGDNRLEGILVGQKSQPGHMSVATVGYTLNDGSLVLLPTIGSVVIPLPPSLGTHSLCLHGNDTLGHQTDSMVVQFTCWFDRQLFVISHLENGFVLVENGQVVGDGISSLSPSTDLNITIRCYATKNVVSTAINTTIYLRINGDPWQAPFPVVTTIGSSVITFIIPESDYVLGDVLDYYVSIKQMDQSMHFLQQYYWTKNGIKYFETDAYANPFHRRISPVPYQLTLNYSAFYQAEQHITLPDENGINRTLTDYGHVTAYNFTLKYFNTTSSMERFHATSTDLAIPLEHWMVQSTSVIYNNVSATVIGETDGIMSPFILPVDMPLIEMTSTIDIPIILFTSKDYRCTDNYLEFSGIQSFTYTGIKRDWYYGARGLKEFKIETGLIDACIRFDVSTGIMVYFMYNDKTPGAGKLIYIGLSNNNMSYPINMKIEKRLECADTWDTLCEPELYAILHDPPGDNSYTQITEGSTTTTRWHLERSYGVGGFFDFQITKTIGGGASFEGVYTWLNETDWAESITTTRSFTSSMISDDPAYIGPGRGDVYVGYALFAHYSFYVHNYYFVINASDDVDPRDRDLNVYMLGSHVNCEFTPNTTFSVLASDLGKFNATSLATQDKFADNFLNSYERTRVKERPNSPLYFTGGTVSEFSTTTTTTTSNTHSYTFTLDARAFFAWDFDAYTPGVGVKAFQTSGRIGGIFQFTTSHSNTTEITTENTVLVHLEDDDTGDAFKIQMYDDLDFGSIGFIVDPASTYTTRPFEHYSSDRRPPTTCEFTSLTLYQHGIITLQVIAIDEELRDGRENNVFQVDFYWDDDPVFGSDKTFIGTQTYLQKPASEDPNIFSVSWDTRLRPTGNYYIFAVAWDTGEELPPYTNSLVSWPALIYVDNSPPSSCRATAYRPYSGSIDLYTNAFDAESGIGHVEYWDGNPSSAGSKLLGIALDPSNSYNFVWATNPDGSEDGLHHIYARAYDQAGNSLVSPVLDVDVQQSSSAQQSSGIDPGSAILVGSLIIAAVIGFSILLRPRPVSSKQPQKSPRAVPPGMEKDTPATPDQAIDGSNDVKETAELENPEEKP